MSSSLLPARNLTLVSGSKPREFNSCLKFEGFPLIWHSFFFFLKKYCQVLDHIVFRGRNEGVAWQEIKVVPCILPTTPFIGSEKNGKTV